MNADRVQSLHGAEPVEIDRQVAAAPQPATLTGYGRRARRRARAARTGSGSLQAGYQANTQADDDRQGADEHHARDGMTTNFTLKSPATKARNPGWAFFSGLPARFRDMTKIFMHRVMRDAAGRAAGGMIPPEKVHRPSRLSPHRRTNTGTGPNSIARRQRAPVADFNAGNFISWAGRPARICGTKRRALPRDARAGFHPRPKTALPLMRRAGGGTSCGAEMAGATGFGRHHGGPASRVVQRRRQGLSGAGRPELIVPVRGGRAGTDLLARLVKRRPRQAGSASPSWWSIAPAPQPPNLGTLVGGARARPDGTHPADWRASGWPPTRRLYAKLGFDPLADLAPVDAAGEFAKPCLVVPPPPLPGQFAGGIHRPSPRRGPGELNYALLRRRQRPRIWRTEMFMGMTGIRMVHVPYGGRRPRRRSAGRDQPGAGRCSPACCRCSA